MKRIITLLLAAGLVFGAASVSQATDVKVKGVWQFNFEWSDRTFMKNDGQDTFLAQQRLRTQVDFIASENLKGVVFFEIGHTNWGQGGGAFGTDGKDVKVRYSYIDWVIPETEVKVRMGLQPFSLPNFTAGYPILGGGNSDGAGITVSADFTENVGATLFWLRALNLYDNTDADNDYRSSNAMDFVGLTVPLKFDGVKVTPWAMYGHIGRDSLDAQDSPRETDLRYGLFPVNGGDIAAADDRYGNAWWIGFASELTMFNPFRIALDAAYGSVDSGSYKMSDGNNFDLKRRGWYTSLLAEYKFDMVTPGLLFWYASGDDDDPYDGSEMLPTIQSSWQATSYGFDGAYYNSANCIYGTSIAGTWGVVAQLKDITFLEDLSHLFRVAYYSGTNDKEMAPYIGSPFTSQGPGLYLTKKDHVWEVNLDSEYKIYEDLTLVLELGYMNLKVNEGVWGSAIYDNVEKNNYKAGINLQYAF